MKIIQIFSGTKRKLHAKMSSSDTSEYEIPSPRSDPHAVLASIRDGSLPINQFYDGDEEELEEIQTALRKVFEEYKTQISEVLDYLAQISTLQDLNNWDQRGHETYEHRCIRQAYVQEISQLGPNQDYAISLKTDDSETTDEFADFLAVSESDDSTKSEAPEADFAIDFDLVSEIDSQYTVTDDNQIEDSDALSDSPPVIHRVDSDTDDSFDDHGENTTRKVPTDIQPATNYIQYHFEE